MRAALPIAARLPLLLPFALLSACGRAVLDPAGDVARQQRNLIGVSTGLMLLIIVPVLVLIVVFAWRYRARNEATTYDPDFDHSTSLELVIWSAPLLIIIMLGALTWSSTHLLDPFRPIHRITAARPVAGGVQPLVVQVVSLDWKWLFIYPEQGIATVNELALPLDRPVRFDITSANMMNTFYAPAMAGMVYAMPGMRSTLHAVLDRPGTYDGYSANYSGAGFSDMHFVLRAMPAADFDRWIAAARSGGRALTTADYLRLERPSEKVPPARFAAVQAGLFDRVVQRCVAPGQPCMSEVMAHDRAANGGPTGRASLPQGPQRDGALFQNESEMAPAPNVTKPRQPGAPGAGAPASPRNRDMS